METITRVSTKGQIVLPKALRESRGWKAGTELTIEDTPQGVLLRPKRLFPKTTIDQVCGIVKSNKKAPTEAQMRAAIARGVKRRHDLGRY